MYSSFKFIERLLASEIANHSDMHTVFKARILNPAFTAIPKQHAVGYMPEVSAHMKSNWFLQNLRSW